MTARPTPFSFPDREPHANAVRGRPRADGGGVNIQSLTIDELGQLLRGERSTSSGAVVTVDSAMRVAVAFRCVHILAGPCGNLPIDLYRKQGASRDVATGHPLRKLLQRPNAWQTSTEFRKMLTAHAVLKGNGYAIKVKSMGRTIALWPLKNPDRMTPKQDPATMQMTYEWARDDGSRLTLAQDDVLHLRGLSLDGVKGIGVLAYARQALGLSLQAEEAAARMFRQGVIAGLVFTKPGALSDEAFDRLRDQLDEKAGAENARKALILEDDLKVDGSLMTAEDLQFLESREFSRDDIGMFFGVPPHMYGDTDKASSWGTGIEAIGAGFVTYTADDWFVMWEQALERDMLTPDEIAAGYYVRMQRQALLRGDMKSRFEAYGIAIEKRVFLPNEIRALEDVNPRPGGDNFDDQPTTAGKPGDPATQPKDPAK